MSECKGAVEQTSVCSWLGAYSVQVWAKAQVSEEGEAAFVRGGERTMGSVGGSSVCVYGVVFR